MPRKQVPREAPDLEPDIEPDAVGADSIEAIPGESDIPVPGGFAPSEDGGNSQHPVHDEDEEDLTPDDYEREIDNADGAG